MSWILWYKSIDLAREDISNKLVYLISLCLKKSGVTTQGRREVVAGILLVVNDKNIVIVGKVLSYF